MTDTTIEWTDKTWNPVTGCSKVSEGCRNCYAETISLRFKRSVGPWNAVNAPLNVITHPDRLMLPLSWKKPAKIFVNSMSDLFHELVPDEFIDQVFAIMAATQHHTYQILTKRPERMAAYVNGVVVNGKLRTGILGSLVTATGGDLNGKGIDPFWMLNIAYKDWPWPLPNVWLGTSTEDQRSADERIPHLLRTPAAVRFLSMEPLLGPVDLTRIRVGKERGQLGDFDQFIDAVKPAHVDDMGFERRLKQGVDWVITGGESGPRHRSIDPEWARSLRDQCVMAGVPFFFKQWSGRTPKAHGRLLDGRTWDQFPASVTL